MRETAHAARAGLQRTIRLARSYRIEHPAFTGSDRLAAALHAIETFRPTPEHAAAVERAVLRSEGAARVRYYGPRTRGEQP